MINNDVLFIATGMGNFYKKPYCRQLVVVGDLIEKWSPQIDSTVNSRGSIAVAAGTTVFLTHLLQSKVVVVGNRRMQVKIWV